MASCTPTFPLYVEGRRLALAAPSSAPHPRTVAHGVHIRNAACPHPLCLRVLCQAALLAALLERSAVSSFCRVQRYLVQCPAVAQAANAIPFKVRPRVQRDTEEVASAKRAVC